MDISQLLGWTNLKQSFEFFDYWYQPCFTIKNMGLKHQYVNHWRKEDLLWTDAKGLKGSVPYSMMDYLWLLMVNQMREYGLPFDLIRKVRDALKEPILISEMVDAVTEQGITYEKYSQEDQKLIKQVFDRIKQGEREALKIEWLTLLTAVLVGTSTHVSLIFNKESKVFPLIGDALDQMFNNPEFQDVFFSSHFSISISELLKIILQTQDLELMVNKIALVNDEEREVLELIRQGHLQELTITFNQDNKMDLVKVTQETKVDLEDRFMDVLLKEGYQDIQFTTHRGKMVSFRKTTKTRIGKK
ncbi:MAG: hypothetical protein ACFB10_21405 [Salibacteraceae bacterium]